MKSKKFIRLVCNTNLHPSGEKISLLKIISKIYDDDGKYLYTKTPYIRASDNQIEIDIDFVKDGVTTDYRQFFPLRHYKHKDGKIIKKSESEIEAAEQTRAQEKQAKEAEKQMKGIEKQNNINIIDDDTKTDKEKISALINLYKGAV